MNNQDLIAYFRDLSYLMNGTPSQQRAYETLSSLDVMFLLRRCKPLLAGTVPLDLDMPGSDLDIICSCPDLPALAAFLKKHFGRRPGFKMKKGIFQSTPTLVAFFETDTFPIQIFTQPTAVQKQRAVRHLLIEKRLLQLVGMKLRLAVRHWKAQGVKTEPAFARYFGVTEDPYLTLQKWSYYSDDQLREIIEATTPPELEADEPDLLFP